MLKIEKKRWPELFGRLAATGELYVPMRQDNKTDFALWQPESEVDIQATITAKSIKNIFFPQIENLLDFERQGQKLSVAQRALPEQKTIAFGVRACDIASFNLLDKVFLQEPVDRFYQARRANCTLIGLACSEPEETCFCRTFGIDPTVPAADITTWLVGDDLFWQAETAKGRELTKTIQDLLTDVEDGEKVVAAQQEDVKALMDKMPLAGFALSAEKCQEQEAIFESEIWGQLSKTCLGCGTCTYVCPTCHCYDIRDYEVNDKVERYRCWDSCMFSDFTNMAGGNPRTTRLERFRQRYMHKLVYFPANNEGAYACVGCGRCLQKCPVSLNIVKVAKSLGVTEDV